MTEKTNIRLSILFGRLIHKIIILDRNEKACQGVTLSQHYAIAALHRKKELTMNALSNELGLAMSTLTRIVDVLVRDGIIQRNPSETDRRKVLVSLTEKGQQIARKLESCTQKFWLNIVKSIPEEKKPELRENLKMILTALDNAVHPCSKNSSEDTC